MIPFRTILSKGKRKFLYHVFGLPLFELVNHKKEKFICPICKYTGPFADIYTETRLRKHAFCPKCSLFERHRLQYLVLEKLAEEYNFATKSILHFAPEPFFKEYFKKIFGSYTSADLHMKDVDYQADLSSLPFEDNSYDFVFASHVLEHVKDDVHAITEIIRVLKPDGIAVLPVPIIADRTVEYPEPNPHEAGHVRAPGPDYYEKYSPYFTRIEKFSSRDFPEEYQLYIYEDRTAWPASMPLRPVMKGNKHSDIIPICFL